jgi:hypothetical protein
MLEKWKHARPRNLYKDAAVISNYVSIGQFLKLNYEMFLAEGPLMVLLVVLLQPATVTLQQGLAAFASSILTPFSLGFSYGLFLPLTSHLLF